MCLSRIIGKSVQIRKVIEFIRKVSKADSNVLITGESGTGKELVANAIHELSDRRENRFTAINCGAIAPDLMESEFFGHEKGAFTGAHVKKIGRLEFAKGGTVFLDEVDALPKHLQVKLLRVLQERSFERVGSNATIKMDVRIIAASNADLHDEIKEGRFREDLYYRLNVILVELPPLRARAEDIPLLIDHYLDKHGRRYLDFVPSMSVAAKNALSAYLWPGNIRELENFMESLVVLATEGREIGISDLPVDYARNGELCDKDFRSIIKDYERRIITDVLQTSNGNKVRTAKLLKIHRNTLLKKMKELGIVRTENE